MAKKAKKHPADTSNFSSTPKRTNPDSSFIGHGLGSLPYDLPLHMEVSRYMGDFPRRKDDAKVPTGLKGWGVLMQCYGFDGAEIEVKIARHPEKILTVWLNGEEIGRIVAE